MKKEVIKTSPKSVEVKTQKEELAQLLVDTHNIGFVFNYGIKNWIAERLFHEVCISAQSRKEVFIKEMEENLMVADELEKARILKRSLDKIRKELNVLAGTDPFKGSPLLMVSGQSVMKSLVDGQIRRIKSNPAGNTSWLSSKYHNDGFVTGMYEYLINVVVQIRNIESSCKITINSKNIEATIQRLSELSEANKLALKILDCKFDDALLASGDMSYYYDELTTVFEKAGSAFNEPIGKLKWNIKQGDYGSLKYLFPSMMNDLLELTETIENCADEVTFNHKWEEEIYQHLFSKAEKELIQKALYNHLILNFIEGRIGARRDDIKDNSPTMSPTEAMEFLKNMTASATNILEASSQANSKTVSASIVIPNQVVWDNSKMNFEEEMNRLIEENKFLLDRENDRSNSIDIMDILKKLFLVVDSARNINETDGFNIPCKLVFNGGFRYDFAELWKCYIRTNPTLNVIYFKSPDRMDTEPIVNTLSKVILVKIKNSSGYVKFSTILNAFTQPE